MTKLSIVRFYQQQKDKLAQICGKKIGRNLLEDPDHPFAFFLSNQFVVSTFFRGKRLKVYAMDRKVFLRLCRFHEHLVGLKKTISSSSTFLLFLPGKDSAGLLCATNSNSNIRW